MSSYVHNNAVVDNTSLSCSYMKKIIGLNSKVKYKIGQSKNSYKFISFHYIRESLHPLTLPLFSGFQLEMEQWNKRDREYISQYPTL